MAAPASLLTLPYELRANIFRPLLDQKGTIEIQQPIWADKTVFVHPLTRVCRALRDQAIELFYQANVFVWTLDPDGDRRSEPARYPLQANEAHHARPSGPLTSVVPWLYPHLMRDLRRLRVNIYLPPSHDDKAWAETFPNQLTRFVRVLDQGRRLQDLRMLVGTWYQLLTLSDSQKGAFDVLEQMQVRGIVQVRAKNIYNVSKQDFRGLDLERRMKADGYRGRKLANLAVAQIGTGKHLDWEWEGGNLLG